MDNDDQGQDSEDEKLNDMDVNEVILDNSTEKVLTVKSEERIIHEASKKIQDLMNANEDMKNEIKKVKPINDVIMNPQQKDLKKQVLSGEITPFQAIEKQSESTKTKGIFNKTSHLLDLEKYLQQQAELAKQRKQFKVNTKTTRSSNAKAIVHKKQKLSRPRNNKRKISSDLDLVDCETENINSNENYKSSKERNLSNSQDLCNTTQDNTKKTLEENIHAKSIDPISDSGSEYIPSDEQIESENEGPSPKKKKCFTKSLHAKRVLDDGDEEMYRQRVVDNGIPKFEQVHKVDNLFKVPQSIWKKLYKYQKVSVQWLWELHCRALGGLLGDEMGLGKTVQVIAFLAGLDTSELLSDGGRFRGLGPTIVVCPATLMEQWVKHFHDWWPVLRVVVLHQSGTFIGDIEYLLHSLKSGGVLITSYFGMLKHKDLLVASQWHYVILDEGHKIRNPQAKISKAVKEFSTPHRLLLTGSPMQNSLKELWSLFDFILPGKLGTLPAFLEHCASPITRGGYANASPLQEATALQVATMLRDAITPYMLRRTKNDVQDHLSLPGKNEQVLFCSLTDEQKKLYKKHLHSEDVNFVLHEKNHMETGRYRARLLVALSALRKICNHPDLYLYTKAIDSDEDIDVSEASLEKFGFWKRSGKMSVVRSLLKIWKKQGHRVLLFTQGRQMMHILESLLQNEEYTYLRMDGTTPMSQRQETICVFNNNPSYFVFLLTTRVGGLGLNLTGANRVVIYDPDWNPATDAQARERAWRIGQNKRVTIYRLITAGTIEEKIYHRQIFKVLLSNKVLEDPRQRRLFKTSDLVELFNFNESVDGHSSESDQLFRESRLFPAKAKFSSNKIEKMRKLAAALSKNISQSTSSDTSTKQTVNISKTVHASSSYNNNNNNSKKKDTLKDNETSKNCSTRPKTKAKSDDRTKSESEFFSEYQRFTNKEVNVEQKAPEDIEYMIEMSTIEMSNNEVENEYRELTNDANNKIKTNEISDKATKESSLNTFGNVECSNKDKGAVAAKTSTMSCKNKQNKKRTRTEKHNISALFEGERISHLIGRRFGSVRTDETKSIEDDQYVLEKLFAKASVTSAFQHDAVLLNSVSHSNDTNPMQRLARETAQENMENIRKSRKWCWKPTWDSASLKND